MKVLRQMIMAVVSCFMAVYAMAQISPNTQYYLKNVNSGLAVNVSGASISNGAAIIQWPYGGTANANWTFVATSNGYYQIVNANSAKVIAVQNAQTTNGAKLIQWSFGAAKNDQWKPVANADGSYTFFNLKSGLVMEVPGNSTAQGVQLDQWAGSGAGNQAFTLNTVGSSSGNIAPNGTAYGWSAMTSSTANTGKAAHPGLNDNNLTADVDLDSAGDAISAWEAGGVIWASPVSLSSASFINGTITTGGDGFLTANLKLQFTTDGSTWTDSGWTVSPSYPYSSSAGGQTYTFSGTAVSGKLGARVIGQVRTVDTSYHWILKEVKFIGPTGSPDFSLSASPTSVSVTQGSSGTSTITENDLNGYTGTVSLSASGLPAGVTATFNPTSTTGSSTLTLTADSTATTGTATVTITGTDGTLTHTTTVTLTVNAPPDFSLSASPSSVTVTQGASGTSTITETDLNGYSGTVSLSASGLPAGVTATFNPISTTSTSTLTLTASSTAATGTATITITGTDGTLTHTTSVTLTVNAVPPDFSLSASPSSVTVVQGTSGTSTITENDLNGYTGTVSLSASGLPAGVTATFNPTSTTGSSTLTLTASSTAATGTATVTITGTDGTLTHTTTISLTVDPAPDFSLSVSPGSVTVSQGTSGTTTVTENDLNGYSGTVSLSASGLPSGVTATFNPTSTTGSSTLTLAADSTATTGTATVTITGTDGTLTHTTTISLTVNPANGLPAGWTDADIGGVGVAGSATYSAGTFTVKGSGTDIFGTGDQFNFTYESVSGDQTVIARVVSESQTAGYSKAGVMIRASLATNSINASVLITPTNGVGMEVRSATGAATINVVGWVRNILPPQWVRLVRSGSTFKASYSSDGSTWTQFASTNVTMSASSFAGLAVTAHNNTALNTATLDNVSVAAPAPDFSLSASPASLNVAPGSSGTSTITETDLNGYSGTVSFSASGLPSGVTASFNPTSTTGNSTLTLTASSSAATGTSTITVTGTDGTLTHTTTVSLTVGSTNYTAAQVLQGIKNNMVSSKQVNTKPHINTMTRAMNVNVYQVGSGVFAYTSSMAIDDDGSDPDPDPDHQGQTTWTDNSGKALGAHHVAFYVLGDDCWDNEGGSHISPCPHFFYAEHNIKGLQFALIFYNGKVIGSVFGDTQTANNQTTSDNDARELGEASVHAASMLGIPSSGTTGGVDNGVTVVIFSGSSWVVKGGDSTTLNNNAQALIQKALNTLGPQVQ